MLFWATRELAALSSAASTNKLLRVMTSPFSDSSKQAYPNLCRAKLQWRLNNASPRFGLRRDSGVWSSPAGLCNCVKGSDPATVETFTRLNDLRYLLFRNVRMSLAMRACPV